MSNIYTWSVNSLECYPLLQDKNNVVSKVIWTCLKTDGINAASFSNSHLFNYVEENAFIPFEQLTNEIVIGWIKKELGTEGVNAVQSNLDNQINNLVNPSIITPDLPWVK